MLTFWGLATFLPTGVTKKSCSMALWYSDTKLWIHRKCMWCNLHTKRHTKSMPSSRVRSYLMQRCAYLGKAALGGMGRERCGSDCYLQRMQNSKWVKCKLGESPNNVLIPRNFLIVKVAVSFFFVTAQQTLTTNVWLCVTCREEQESTCCETFRKGIWPRTVPDTKKCYCLFSEMCHSGPSSNEEF